ncbi:hypothetical protein HHK36_001032 [Tetracentron sinense]|uniref:Uncharacterized protein n=1 Tax=Tetracentron sinense TaxID=13715 RepID=A0A835DR91_TETSI|nr:hypothetical protein HHK36_001032 [Tetracentron sinense]
MEEEDLRSWRSFLVSYRDPNSCMSVRSFYNRSMLFQSISLPKKLLPQSLSAQYAKVMILMKTVREKADMFSESQWIQYTIQTQTQGILDVRTYLLTLKEIRIKRDLTDELGAEAMMMDAPEKVEK